MNANIPDDRDKKGDALKAQRFIMLEDIAKELSGEVVFPTYFDAILRLRKVLQDPEHSMADITRAVSVEPLISAKLLHMANSVAFNPQGREVLDLKSAIMRLGLNAVRSATLVIVMTQLRRARGLAEFADLTQHLWEHSIKTSAAARVIAGSVPRLNADEAMLAGLIHDLGAFYMLYRATQYDELRQRPDSIRYLIIQWHESIGVSLLNAIGLPEEIVDAAVDHDRLRPPPSPVRSLKDVIYVANILAGGFFECQMQDQPEQGEFVAAIEEKYRHLAADIEAMTQELRAAYA